MKNNDLCPERPLIDISMTIWHDTPSFAAAILGYCEGRLGERANPPSIGKAPYMQEYLIGAGIRTKQGEK